MTDTNVLESCDGVDGVDQPVDDVAARVLPERLASTLADEGTWAEPVPDLGDTVVGVVTATPGGGHASDSVGRPHPFSSLASPTRHQRYGRFAAVVTVLVLLAAGCGGDDAAEPSGDSGVDTGVDTAEPSGDPTVEIANPTDGAQVGPSFDVQMNLNFPIGEPDTGRQHIHLHFDGSPEYEIVYEDMHSVTLEAGEHTIVAVVANADHSETDSQSSEITVELSADDSGSGTNDTPPTSGGSVDY